MVGLKMAQDNILAQLEMTLGVIYALKDLTSLKENPIVQKWGGCHILYISIVIR
jgi:hypothetical protein